MLQAKVTAELDQLLEYQTQLDLRMASFQHMLYVGPDNICPSSMLLISVFCPLASCQLRNKKCYCLANDKNTCAK